jgi:PAS domain S-box-containing protein
MKGTDEKFLKLFHNSLVGMILTDEHHRVTDINDHLLHLTRLKRADAIGKTGIELGLMNEDTVKKMWEQMAETGKLSNIELTITTKENKNIIILFSTERVNLNGYEHWLSTIIDISAKKKAEEKITGSELRFRTLTKTAPVGIFETDADGNTTYVNEAWMEYSGLSLKEAMNGEWMNMIHPEDREEQVNKWHTRSQKGEASFSEYRIIDRSGHLRWVSGRAIPLINDEGLITGYIGTISDVTRIKEAHELLKESHEALNERTEQLRELSTHLHKIREDERTTIAQEIHDELGQQLTGLKMDITWIRKRIKKEDNTINNKLDDAILLIDETVRSIKRIAAELRPSIIDDLGIVAAIEWQIKDFADRLGIEMQYQNDLDDEHLDPNISIGLFRILQESLTNIARHAKAKKVFISIVRSGGEVRLMIRDDGIGFDTSLKKEEHTFGLLGIKERTYMMKGDCQIHSKPGEGTGIVISIPVS